MSRRAGLLSGLAAVFGGCAQAAPLCVPLSGRWGGVLRAGPATLRLVLEVTPAGEVTLVSVDQGGARIPASGGSCDGTSVDLQFAAVRGRLQARVEPDGALVGSWSQGTALPVRFERLPEGKGAPDVPTVTRGPLAREVPEARAESGAPALVAGWRRGGLGSVIADGLRSVGARDAVTETDLWHVGSITKSMTATMVARLVERGLIRWDETLGSAFGTLAPEMNPAYRPATLAQLMTGQAGLPTNIPMTRLLRFPRAEADPRESRIAWVRAALAMAPEGSVGQGHVYPNNGFVLAGALCEARTGKAWETLMREEVFGPLGMSSAGFGPPPAPDLSKPANPVGHRPAMLGGRAIAHGAGPDADNPAALGPAGRAHMTLADLLAFGAAHLGGLNASGDGAPAGYLSRESWQRLHTPGTGIDYAMGWLRRPDGASWHNGSNTLFYAELLVDPAQGTIAAAATNFAGAESAVVRVMDAARQEAIRAKA